MVNSLLRRLSRTAFRHGMAGDHWAWFVLALAAVALRRARRPLVEHVELAMAPGDRVLVSLADPRAAGADPRAAGADPLPGD